MVSIYQKGTQDYWSNGDGLWECGEIYCCGSMGRKAVNVGDRVYKLGEVEVYLIKYC